MRSIGRPTEEEIDRLKELAEQYFVGDKWAIKAKLWDDDDVHLEAFSTIGTSHAAGYEDTVAHHRQIIRYERQSQLCEYENRVSYASSHRSKKLNEFYIDW
jgi:hypothetical protein